MSEAAGSVVAPAVRPRGLSDAAWLWGAAALLAALLCLPFLATPTPALLDYPNHLARVFILSHPQDPMLAAAYTPHWAVLPNLAMDGIGTTLARVLPIMVTSRILLVGAVLLLASGLLAVSAALHGTPRPFALLGFLFVFSEPFAWGFLNLVLGFGLALWGVAAWIRCRDRPVPLILAWSVPFATLLFLAHLFAFGAFGAFGLTLAGIKLAHLRARPSRTALGRMLLLGAATAAIPVMLFLFASPTPVTDSATQYGTLLARLRSMPLAPVRNFSDVLDVATMLAVVALLAFGTLSRRLTIAPALRLALILLLAVCFLVPRNLGSSDNAEIRLPVFTALLLAAAADWRAGRREVLAGLAALAILLGARTGAVMAGFAQGSHFTAELRAALGQLPHGVRLAAITVTRPGETRTEAAWPHSICYAVIDESDFVANVFAAPTQQPMLFAPRYRDQAFPPRHFVSAPGRTLDPAEFARLDYVVIVNPAALQTPLPATLEPVAAGREFILYRVRKQRD